MKARLTRVYQDWINNLKDPMSRAKIQMRVDRLIHGNPGQHRQLTNGISELKIDFGPGYRVYYTIKNNEIIILLVGGDKSTQQQDIKQAIKLTNNLPNFDDETY